MDEEIMVEGTTQEAIVGEAAHTSQITETQNLQTATAHTGSESPNQVEKLDLSKPDGDVEQKTSERLFTRDELAKIVNAEANKAYLKAKGEVSSVNVDDQKIRQMIQQEADHRANMLVANRISEEFQGKIDQGKEKYSDFSKVVDELNLLQNPELVLYTNTLDNTADVLYELYQNSKSLVDVNYLIKSNPKIAIRELKKLSDSIKQNESAKKAPRPNQPLSSVSPSTANNVDMGDMRLADFKKASWLKG